MVDSKHPETLAVHAGYRNDPTTGFRGGSPVSDYVVPI